MEDTLKAKREYRRKARLRSYYKNHQQGKDRIYDRHARKTYGITIEDYRALELAQNGRCAICGGPPTGRGRLHLDHDHVTGRVRGLLCSACNTGLGGLKDDPSLLHAAIDYLERCKIPQQDTEICICTDGRTDVQKNGQELPLIPITGPHPCNPRPGPVF